MISCMYIRSCIWVIGFLSLAGASPWADPSLEALDELNDAELYRAVVDSMNEWQHKHDLKRTTNRTKRADPSVCYKDLGCFEASGPFGYLDMLPSKPQEINTRFLMYPARTRRRRSGSAAPAEVPFEKLDDAFEWAKSGFNHSLPTKVLIHGFGSDCGYIWAYEIRSALMAVEEVNTICVDWSNGASLPNYVKASANTRLVGKQVSLLLKGLIEKNGLSLKNTHLIGFSLGAHVAGFAGAELGNLSRISGLDPAGPLFEAQDTRARLDETDADFVDVIHSNGENLILGGLGSSQPMGHVDFYPNGGRMQKGCSHLFVGAVSDIIWSSAVEGRSLCNHRRAYKFFIDSVSPRCHFPAFPCKSYDDFIAGKCFPCTEERKCGNMGYYADRSKGRGQLFLITRDEEPFCAHQYLIKIESTPSPVPVKSYGKIQITLIGDSFLNETFMLTKKEDEEMNLGDSLSRILVPHPILSQPSKIEILYTAYSGWLSSGLTQWKVDKVSLMDSFGKMSSVCKKSVVLESGKPVTLTLHPGECNSKKESSFNEAEDKLHQAENKYPGFNNFNKDGNNTNENGFIPTQVVKVGLNDNSKEYEIDRSSSYTNDVDMFPWKTETEDNLLDSEVESSRAFNTKIIKADKLNKNLADSDGLIREIVEPILKPQSFKNARSHDPDRDKPEITEPILGPTTARNGITPKKNNTQNDDDAKNAIWKERTTEKWRRQDESKALGGFGPPFRNDVPHSNNPLEAIVSTVQFLPQRLARMFEQAEKYARDNILPLVSTYTPRFIADFIAPRETPRYVPLHYEDDEIQDASSSKKVGVVEQQSRSINAQTDDPLDASTESVTAPFTHIQKITKKKPKEKIEYIFPTNRPPGTMEAMIQSQSTSTVASSTTRASEGYPITSTFKNTNTFTFNRANSHITIEMDPPHTQNSRLSDNSRSLQNLITNNGNANSSTPGFRPLEALVGAIQNFPGLTQLLDQAQNFTRSIIENYNPDRFSDLFWVRPRPNVTMNVNQERTNTTQLQENKVSINLSVEKDTPRQPSSTEAYAVTSSTFKTSKATVNASPTTTTKPKKTENFSSVQNIGQFMSTTTASPVPVPVTNKSVPTTSIPPASSTDRIDTTTMNIAEVITEISSTTMITTSEETTPPASTSTETIDLITTTLLYPRTKSDSKETTTTSVSSGKKGEILIFTTPKSIMNVSPYNLIPSGIPKDKSRNMDPVEKYVSKSVPYKTIHSHIQRIPKRGEKVKLDIPYPFTIVIDPNDLTTTTTSTTTSTTTTARPIAKKEFVSYVQKIPKKGEKLKMPSFKVFRTHPMVKDTRVDHKVITLKNMYGADMTYRITSDGRFEV